MALEAWGIPLDVVPDGVNIVVRASVPGVDPKQIDPALENGILVIKAETRSETGSKDARVPGA